MCPPFEDDIRDTEPPAPTPRQRILAAVEQLAGDELAVLACIAERLVIGRMAYGQLDVAADARDWVHEGMEELVDGLAYLTIALLRRDQRAPPGRLVGADRGRPNGGDHAD